MLKFLPLLIAAMAGAPLAAASAAEKPLVLVAFAGDKQIGFIRPSDTRAEGSSRVYSVLWIYTPPQPSGSGTVHRAVWQSVADCARGTIEQRAVTFYGPGQTPIGTQTLVEAEPETVMPSSPGEDVLRFVCSGVEPYPDIRLSADEGDAASLAQELAAFYRANPTR